MNEFLVVLIIIFPVAAVLITSAYYRHKYFSLTPEQVLAITKSKLDVLYTCEDYAVIKFALPIGLFRELKRECDINGCAVSFRLVDIVKHHFKFSGRH